MSEINNSLRNGLITCAAFLTVMSQGPARAEVPEDRSAQESGRVARAREHRDAEALAALADEYETRWKRGERGEHIYKALHQITGAVNSWEWDNLDKQVALPIRIALFVLENGGADAPLDVQIGMACCLSLSPDRHAPSFTAAERKRRALLLSQVLQRVLARVDPTVDLSARVFLNVSPPDGVPHAVSGMDPKAIKDPALRAEYERRIREDALLAQKQSEQWEVLRQEKRLLLPFERYLTSVYSSDPEAGPEFEKILTDVKQSAKGNSPDIDAMVGRVANRVKASWIATRPAEAKEGL